MFKIVQIISAIGTTKRVKDTLRSLGLGKIGNTGSLKDLKEHHGRLRVIRHMVEIREEATGKIVQVKDEVKRNLVKGAHPVKEVVSSQKPKVEKVKEVVQKTKEAVKDTVKDTVKEVVKKAEKIVKEVKEKKGKDGKETSSK
jgi:large subunit ribosomal protein L30